MGEHRLGQDVVGEPVGEPGHRVRGQRRDHHQVRVLQVRVGIRGRRPARERVERLGRDEPLCPGRGKRQHVVPGGDEQANQLACLVGGDATGDADDDPGHGDILPANRATGLKADAEACGALRPSRPRRRAP